MDSSLKSALSLVRKERILDVAQRLIRIPSVTGEELAIAHHAKDLLESKGLNADFYGERERPIVLSTVNEKASPFIALNGHLDTVPAADTWAWKRDPFDPRIEEGKLFGRGASDMKASCAVMIHVLEILNEIGVNCAVCVQLVPDEEMGGEHGTRLLLSEMDRGSLRKPDYAVIGEKSNLKIRIAERGSFGFSIRFRGKATHTAYARTEGVNAITKALKGVIALEKGIDKYHCWIGHPVLSVNSIHAGTVPNQVPAECVIGVDRRLIIGEDPETVVAEVESALSEAGGGDPEWNWELDAKKGSDGRYLYSPPSFTSPENELVMAFFRAVPTVTGKESELFVEWAGGTDGRFYRYAGIPTVGFGPKGEHAHGPNEFVYVESLVEQAKIYLTAILNLSSEKN